MRRPGRAAAAALLAAASGLGCAGERREPPRGVLTVSVEQQASWIRNFNPLAPQGVYRWPAVAGVYEPLLVFSSVRGELVPWLASAYEWRDGNRTLRVTAREGVLWSDGTPFTARDVAFTFQLLKRFPALDQYGVWGFLSRVRAVDERTVDFELSRVFLPGLDDIACQPIVPEHVFAKVDDPLTFANEKPVATGPFTEVRTFQNQVYELGRNLRYWQKGKPAVDALRFPAYPSNERANLALAFGEVDWAGNFVPAIDRVYAARDPEHHRYWSPLTGSTIFLYANALKPPFDDARVRKALSLAIDRKLLVDVALYGYSRPADATGLSDAYATWRDARVGAAGWVAHDPEGAERLLDEAGCARGPDHLRRCGGRPLRYEILVASGWSDWVRAAQVIARGLKAVGVEASVRAYDYGAWFERLQKGEYDLSLGWATEGATPYTFYEWLMASATVKPLGERSLGNWNRYGSKAADALLAAFEREPGLEAQRELSRALQRVFAAEAPAIPLYPNPSWAEYSTRRFTGFPSAENPYADPSPNKYQRAECLLVLTQLTPR